MQCKYEDCFAWDNGKCRCLSQIEIPKCSFYKPYEQVCMENTDMDREFFRFLFGKEMADRRREVLMGRHGGDTLRGKRNAGSWEHCGNCEWYRHQKASGRWICVNADSDYCANYTDYGFGCDKWEKKVK